ncbi:MAG TPA: hypothetical protein PLL09_08110 [Flavobacterium sp.]|uniref:hypothetical protein n=1 Tax=unclassified Flavobacterium TaxID=196869 RepID=UPI000E8DFCFF|nr:MULTISPECIES: hypothetical protein [unclassified Flavobacterium]HBI00102.1 hypothetical protein [Flavobacterium sp.]HRE77773.1 hypothetical protein [Flavobacterium sp.]
MIPHKKCNCPEDDWEEIVVKGDLYFPNKTVIYYHCDCCGEDFRIEDFETRTEVFITTLLSENQ